MKNNWPVKKLGEVAGGTVAGIGTFETIPPPCLLRIHSSLKLRRTSKATKGQVSISGQIIDVGVGSGAGLIAKSWK